MDIKGLFAEALLLQGSECIRLRCHTEQKMNSLRQQLIRERGQISQKLPEVASALTISCYKKPDFVIVIRKLTEPVVVERMNARGGITSTQYLNTEEDGHFNEGAGGSDIPADDDDSGDYTAL